MPSDKTDGEPRDTFAARVAHFVEQSLAELKNLLRAIEGRLAGLGHRDAAPGGLQQLAPNRFLQFAHLRADRLDRHVEPFGRAREAALLHDDPEIVQMTVVEHASDTSK